MQKTDTNFNKSKPAMTLKNTGTLTLSEFRQMRERMQVGSLGEDQERKVKEVTSVD
jgi:hypothetical protein